MGTAWQLLKVRKPELSVSDEAELQRRLENVETAKVEEAPAWARARAGKLREKERHPCFGCLVLYKAYETSARGSEKVFAALRYGRNRVQRCALLYPPHEYSYAGWRIPTGARR